MKKYIEYEVDLNDGRTVFIKTNYQHYEQGPINACTFYEHELDDRLAELLFLDPNILEVQIFPLVGKYSLIYAR